jgi:hypothetical protein
MIEGAPGLLNSLDEIAAAIGDDPAFFTTLATNLATKAPLASPTFTGTVSGVTKAHVGLGNVDNTSDANKPVSTATQTALDLKANTSAITELAQDAVNSAIVAGTGLDKTYDDAANTITIDIDSTVATKTYVTNAVTGATVDQSALAGTGLAWDGVAEQFTIDSTVATKTYADNAATTAVAAVVNSAPAALDTLKELADALTADESTASTLATLVGTKANAADVTTALAGKEDKLTSAQMTNKVITAVSGSSYGLIGTSEYLDVKDTNGYNKEIELDIAAVEAKLTTDGYAKQSDIATAKTAAEATASADATTKADAAKAFATAADTTLRTAVTNDIATAKSQAISAAAADATSKANAAQTAAEATASGDATTKVSNAVAALTKSSVGLANVDNTSDANKPVSTATQTALDLKAPLASPALTGNPTAPTQTVGNDSTRVATTAFVKAAIQDIASLNLVLDGGGV